MNCNYKVKITDIQTKYKFKVFCTGYDDSEIKEKIDTMYEAWPKASGEGETPTLDNTANATMSIDLKGNTSQSGEPTPDAPIPVNVVSGDNTIKVEGKNFFNYNVITNSSYYTNNYDGSFTRNSNGSSITINVDTASVPYNTFSLLAGTYSVSFDVTTTEAVTINNWFLCTVQNGTTSNLAKSIGVQIPANTITHIKAENYVVVNNAEKVGFAGYLSASTGVVISNIQVEKNNQATTYEAYKGASYPLSLGDIELCKIGDYQDSIVKDDGAWYLNKQIGKVVFTSATSWYYDTSGNRFATSISGSRTENQRFPIVSNYFRYISSDGENGGGFNFGGSIYLYNYDCTSTNEFQTWLGTHNTDVYYPLATPTYTEITNTTLISQLDALETAMSYKGQTNISQINNDAPFIISASALYDLNNLVTRVAILETE